MKQFSLSTVTSFSENGCYLMFDSLYNVLDGALALVPKRAQKVSYSLTARSAKLRKARWAVHGTVPPFGRSQVNRTLDCPGQYYA